MRGPPPPGRLPEVHIHYHRPPDRTDVFVQRLIRDDPWVKISCAEGIELDEPLRIDGRIVLERGSDVVWFTFPGEWHDIGRFHRRDGTLTGIYANILSPCVFEPGGDWYTTDLFLDLWIPARKQGGIDGRAAAPRLLDLEQIAEAEERGWIAPATGERARREAERLLSRARASRWPHPVVHEWTRERALSILADSRRPGTGGP